MISDIRIACSPPAQIAQNRAIKTSLVPDGQERTYDSAVIAVAHVSQHPLRLSRLGISFITLGIIGATTSCRLAVRVQCPIVSINQLGYHFAFRVLVTSGSDVDCATLLTSLRSSLNFFQVTVFLLKDRGSWFCCMNSIGGRNLELSPLVTLI